MTSTGSSGSSVGRVRRPRAFADEARAGRHEAVGLPKGLRNKRGTQMTRMIGAHARPSRPRRAETRGGPLSLVVAAIAPALALAASSRVQNGLYASKANNKTPYSNGGVDLTVYGKGRGSARRPAAWPATPAPPDSRSAGETMSCRCASHTRSRSARVSGSRSPGRSPSAQQMPRARSRSIPGPSLKGRFVKGKHGKRRRPEPRSRRPVRRPPPGISQRHTRDRERRLAPRLAWRLGWAACPI